MCVCVCILSSRGEVPLYCEAAFCLRTVCAAWNVAVVAAAAAASVAAVVVFLLLLLLLLSALWFILPTHFHFPLVIFSQSFGSVGKRAINKKLKRR